MNQNEPTIEMLGRNQAIEIGQKMGLLEPIAELNIFRTLLKHPDLASSINSLLETFLFKNKIDSKLRELLIMRTGWLHGCDYEWTHHYEIAKAYKVEENQIIGIRQPTLSADIFNSTELTVLNCADELKNNDCVTQKTMRDLYDCVEEEKDRFALEIIGIAVTWKLISQLLLSLGVTLEEHLTSWPPDGKSTLDQ